MPNATITLKNTQPRLLHLPTREGQVRVVPETDAVITYNLDKKADAADFEAMKLTLSTETVQGWIERGELVVTLDDPTFKPVKGAKSDDSGDKPVKGAKSDA